MAIEVKNDEPAPPENVPYLKHCSVCGEPLFRTGRYCSQSCRMLWAECVSLFTLQFILGNARWAGAPSQAAMEREYFHQRMWEAVRRLPHSEDVLVEVLSEIAEQIAGEATSGRTSSGRE